MYQSPELEAVAIPELPPNEPFFTFSQTFLQTVGMPQFPLLYEAASFIDSELSQEMAPSSAIPCNRIRLLCVRFCFPSVI